MATKITAFDKQNLKLIGAEIEAAVQEIANKYGLKLVGGIGGRYQTTEYTIKGTLKVTDPEVTAKRQRDEFEAYSRLFGFSPEMYRAQFRSAGRTFVLTGFKPNAPKMPVLAQCLEDGKTYKFGESVLAMVLRDNPKMKGSGINIREVPPHEILR